MWCADRAEPSTHRICGQCASFTREDDGVYRNSTLYCETIDRVSGRCIARQWLKTNHARVLHDTAGLDVVDVRTASHAL